MLLERIACRACDIGDDRTICTDECIEQRGFTGIRLPQDDGTDALPESTSIIRTGDQPSYTGQYSLNMCFKLVCKPIE